MNGLIGIHLAVLLFGLSGLFGKFLDHSPLLIVFGRTLFASFVLGALAWKNGSKIRTGSAKTLLLFALLGATLALHWITFFHAIQVSSVAVGLISFSTFPLFATFMEPVFFRERLRLIDLPMAMAVTCGMVLVVPSFDLGNNITLGAFWGTVSGFTFAILSLLNRKYVRDYPATVIAFYQNGFATLTLLPFALFCGVPAISIPSLLSIAFLGIFCTALAHTLFIRGLSAIKVQTASVIAGLEPVYGVIFAFFLLGEIPTLSMAAGGAIIIGATLAVSLIQASGSR